MCGIAGTFAYRTEAPPVTAQELLVVRDAMTPRGPDGAGLWISADARVGLAHRRLAVIDLSDAGAQPMKSADGMLQIVFNGEIYNYKSLRADLEKKGCIFRSESDTEVLLHLYAERGPEMVQALRGMYALAIWDERVKSLLLARDPFGIKPLYYVDDGNRFCFASQVKALLKGPRIDTRPEPAGHVGFLLWGSVPEPYTLYRGIRALPAGCTMWVNDHGQRKPKPFFSVNQMFAEAEAKVEVVENVRDALASALRDSVRHHLVADVPVGVFLSAGLDSSIVALVAAEEVAEPLRTITLGFQEYAGSRNDETILAEKIAHRLGSRHQTRWITGQDFEAECERLFRVMDQPTIDGVNTYFVAKAAAEMGLKVALSGLGGDELFGSYPSFQDVPRMVRICRPFHRIPWLGRTFRIVTASFLKRMTSPKYAGLFEYGGTFGGAYLLRRGLYMPWELYEILDADFVEEGWRELQPLIKLENTIEGLHTERFKVSALELCWYMRNQLLRDADWAGMAHSLEIRVPLIDEELLRKVAALLRIEPFLSKQDAMAVLGRSFPSEVLARSKTGFAIPVLHWLSNRLDVNASGHGLRCWAQYVYRQECPTV